MLPPACEPGHQWLARPGGLTTTKVNAAQPTWNGLVPGTSCASTWDIVSVNSEPGEWADPKHCPHSASGSRGRARGAQVGAPHHHRSLQSRFV